jgi:hypothetical protein
MESPRSSSSCSRPTMAPVTSGYWRGSRISLSRDLTKFVETGPVVFYPRGNSSAAPGRGKGDCGDVSA